MRTKKLEWILTVASLILLGSSACSSDGRRFSRSTRRTAKICLDISSQVEKTHPDIDVQWVDIGWRKFSIASGPRRTTRKRSLVRRAAEAFNRATRKRLVQPYIPTWSNSVSVEGRDQGDNSYRTYFTPEVIGYNMNGNARGTPEGSG